MRITANVYKQNPEVSVEHNGEVVTFSASVFTRKAFQREEVDVFESINRYWASLSPAIQQEIWLIYKNVYRGFDQIFSSDELYAHLKNCIIGLMQYHPLDRLELWISMDPSIVIPIDMKDSFVESIDSNNTRDKTYTRKDYIQLLALSLFLRTLIPIWGEYINSTRKESGMDRKEYMALQLLSNTGLLESEAMEKLKLYTNQITKEKHRNPEKILDSISSWDMGFWLLALVCVRRLCVSDLTWNPENPKAHIVTLVYKFLYQKVFNNTESDSTVKMKVFSDNSSGSDQNKRSIMESYRKRTELSLGEREEIEFAYEDVYGIAERLAPGITKEAVDSCLQSVRVLSRERLGDPQLVMMSWVFKDVLIPKSVFYASKENSLRALGVLEAVLWHWGHKYLAVVASSHMILGQEEMVIAPIDSRGQINIDLQHEIQRLYPYVWSTQKRNAQTTITEAHPVLLAIDLVVDDLTTNAWRATASDDKMIEVFGEPRRKLPINSGIKSDLARLIIDIENRRT